MSFYWTTACWNTDYLSGFFSLFGFLSLFSSQGHPEFISGSHTCPPPVSPILRFPLFFNLQFPIPLPWVMLNLFQHLFLSTFLNPKSAIRNSRFSSPFLRPSIWRTALQLLVSFLLSFLSFLLSLLSFLRKQESNSSPYIHKPTTLL